MIKINGKYNFIYFHNKHNHRLNGPAIIRYDYQIWFQNGKTHRLNGPAYISDNDRAWYINGKQYTESEFNEKMKLV